MVKNNIIHCDEKYCDKQNNTGWLTLKQKDKKEKTFCGYYCFVRYLKNNKKWNVIWKRDDEIIDGVTD